MSDVLNTAAWSEDPGHWRYNPIGGDGSPMQGRFLLLGEATNAPGFLHVRAPCQHLLTIGPARSGKGVSLIIPNLLNYRGAVLVVDPSGENAWITAEFRRTVLGQKTVIVDPWGEVNRRYGSMVGVEESTARFNPLSILDPGSDDYIEDLSYLADALIITENTKNPYWEDTARELWAGLMAFVVEHPDYAPTASLPLARKLLMQSNEVLQRTIRTAISLPPGSVAALKLAQFDDPQQSTSIASVIAVARVQTAFLDSAVLSRSMETSDFSFDELCGGNISVYLVLPRDKLQTFARWLRLMVSAGIRAVARCSGGAPNLARPQAALGLPVLFMLDEFGMIGKLNAVADSYGLMAGLAMIVWTFAQDLNQLRWHYPQDWETFIGNSEVVTCFGITDNFTAEYISKMLGTSAVAETEISTCFSTSERTTSRARLLLYADEVRGLSGETCLIMGPYAPILSRRIVYHEDWDFLHRARPDPQFPRTENVRWRASQKRLGEMDSVARLLKEYGYKAKALGGGRWEVSGAHGKAPHIFASEDDLWRWMYVLVMGGVDQA